MKKTLVIDNPICIRVENEFKGNFDDLFKFLNLKIKKNVFENNLVVISPLIAEFNVENLDYINCYYTLGSYCEVSKNQDRIKLLDKKQFKDYLHYHVKETIKNLDFKEIKEQLLKKGKEISSVVIISKTEIRDVSYEVFIGGKDVSNTG